MAVKKEVNALTQIMRLAKSKDISGHLSSNVLKGLYAEAAMLTRAELVAKLTDKTLPNTLYTVYSNLLSAASYGKKNQLDYAKYTEDRIYGKLAEVHEHTGKQGEAIELSIKDKFTKALSKTDIKDLKEIKNSIASIATKLAPKSGK